MPWGGSRLAELLPGTHMVGVRPPVHPYRTLWTNTKTFKYECFLTTLKQSTVYILHCKMNIGLLFSWVAVSGVWSEVRTGGATLGMETPRPIREARQSFVEKLVW